MGRYHVKRTYPEAGKRIVDIWSKHQTFASAVKSAKKLDAALRKTLGLKVTDVWITDTLDASTWTPGGTRIGPPGTDR